MVDVKALDPVAPALHLVEQKTGKKRKLVVNGAALKIMQRRLAENRMIRKGSQKGVTH